MDIEISPRINIWFDGEDYCWQIDFEDCIVPDTEREEYEARNLELAIARISKRIGDYVRDAVAQQ